MPDHAAAPAGDAATRLGRSVAGRLDPRRGRSLHSHRGIGRLAGAAAGFGMRVGRPLSVRRALDAADPAETRATSLLPVGLPVPAELAAWWRSTMLSAGEPAASSPARVAVRRKPVVPPRGLPRVASAGARSRMGLGTGPAGASTRLQAETINPRREPAVSAVGTVVSGGEHQFRAPGPGTPPVRPVAPGSHPRPERPSAPPLEIAPGPQAQGQPQAQRQSADPGSSTNAAARAARAVQPAAPSAARPPRVPGGAPTDSSRSRRSVPATPAVPAPSSRSEVRRTPRSAPTAGARQAPADGGSGDERFVAAASAERPATASSAAALRAPVGGVAPRHPTVSSRGVVGRAHTLGERAEALVARRWATSAPLPVAAAAMSRGHTAGVASVTRLGEGLGVTERFAAPSDTRLGGLAAALSRQALPAPPAGWSPSRDATQVSHTAQRQVGPGPRAASGPVAARRAVAAGTAPGSPARTRTPSFSPPPASRRDPQRVAVPDSPVSVWSAATAAVAPAPFLPLQRTLSAPASQWRVLGPDAGGLGRPLGSAGALTQSLPAVAALAFAPRLARAIESPAAQSGTATSARVTALPGALRPPPASLQREAAGSVAPSDGPTRTAGASVVARAPTSDTPAARRRPGAARARRFSAALGARRSDPPRLLPAPLRRLARAIAGPSPVEIRTGPATRAALAAVGRRGATIGRTIHLAAEPDGSPASAEVLAHELVHAAHRPAAPAFFDDHPSPEEHLARRVGTLARLLVTKDATPPARGRGGPSVGTAGLQVAGGFSAAAGAAPIRHSADTSTAARTAGSDLLRRFDAARRAPGSVRPGASASRGSGGTIQRGGALSSIMKPVVGPIADPIGGVVGGGIGGTDEESKASDDGDDGAGGDAHARGSASEYPLASAARFDRDTPVPVPSPPLVHPPGDPLPAETLQWIIERIERRVVEELERRGQRFYPGVF